MWLGLIGGSNVLHHRMSDLGSMVRRLRGQQLLSIADLSSAVGVSQSDLEGLEGGQLDPKYSLILSLSQALGVGEDYLLGYGGYWRFGSTPIDGGVELEFRHGSEDARYRLMGVTEEQLNQVLAELRRGLASARVGKTGAIVKAFFRAVELWPEANASDLWLFLISRAYCDRSFHPAATRNGDVQQSWKRASGYALEAILRSHYGAFLSGHGISVRKRKDNERNALLRSALRDDPRLITDKADVLVTRQETVLSPEKLLGVIHVKASIAERRTDDIPLSQLLLEYGYLSIFWTLDGKSFPSTSPVNEGEYGDPDGEITDKRSDIEDHGYFSACFSYNRNTKATRRDDAASRIYVCDFRNPDDAFSGFLLSNAGGNGSSS